MKSYDSGKTIPEIADYKDIKWIDPYADRLDLYLQCKTQQEIADEIGLDQRTISVKLKEIEEKLMIYYKIRIRIFW